MSNFVQSPITSITQELPSAVAAVSTPASCHQSDNINQATNALLGIISQVISASSSATGLNPSVTGIDINYLFWFVFVSGILHVVKDVLEG